MVNTNIPAKILITGAHPDDIEAGCGASISKWVKQGILITAVVMSCETPTRKKEQEDSFKYLGVTDYVIANFKDGAIPHNKETVSLLDNIIKDRGINTIFTHSEFDSHQDHQNTMKSTMSSGRNVNNFFHFDTVPFKRINFQELSKPTTYVEINNFIDKKINALKFHKSQIKRFPKNWEEILKSEARYKGTFISSNYSEAFYCKKFIFTP
tara:strand:+ start:157 stop:786 length:630 start_codon:yes stop_codon:yes gene_type:complete